MTSTYITASGMLYFDHALAAYVAKKKCPCGFKCQLELVIQLVMNETVLSFSFYSVLPDEPIFSTVLTIRSQNCPWKHTLETNTKFEVDEVIYFAKRVVVT